MSSQKQRSSVALALAVTAGALLLTAPSVNAGTSPVPVIDLHVDLPYRSHFKGKAFAEGSGQFRASELLPAGVKGVVLPLFVPENAYPQGRSLQQLESTYAHVFRSILETRPYSLPGCGVQRASGEPRGISTWLAFEGAGPLGGSEAEVRRFALRGVRSFGLVHSVPNELATSSGKWVSRTGPGLSRKGREFVRAVSKVEGLVDVSHASDAATNETLSLARSLGSVVIATHSNARALAPHARNLTDEQIRGIAATGGIIGVNFHRPFLRKSPEHAPRMDDVVEQILYIRSLGGLQAVAIGSDFEGGISAVPELSSAARFQRLAAALGRAGLPEKEVTQVLHGNAMRVLCPRSVE